jgi:hypothetical protein
MKVNASVARFPMYVVVKSVFTDGKQSRVMVKDRVAANVEIATARFARAGSVQRSALSLQIFL